MGYLDDLASLAAIGGTVGTHDETNVHLVTGLAVGDSSGGYVTVDMGGATVTEGGDQWVILPTTAEVRDGDTVRVELVGADGTAKRMCVTGVVGGGDRTGLVARKAAEYADRASETAATAKQSADAAMAETRDLVTLRIDSSRGTVFKNSEVSTVLTVRCYKRGQELTTLTALRQAMLDATARIRWYVLREGDTDWASLADSDHMISNDGFTLTVTPDDVTVKCTFKAEIVTD